MNRNLIITIMAFCIAVSSSFYMGMQTAYRNTINCQQRLIETQKQLKLYLSMDIARKAHIERLRVANKAFSEVVLMEMDENKWTNIDTQKTTNLGK